MNEMTKLTAKDFATDQEVRWRPGCGDYAVLKAVQRTMPEIGVRPENVVFVSGIGCSSRFPYYMETYGFHTIPGRAPTLATGIKPATPALSVSSLTGARSPDAAVAGWPPGVLGRAPGLPGGVPLGARQLGVGVSPGGGDARSTGG